MRYTVAGHSLPLQEPKLPYSFSYGLMLRQSWASTNSDR